MSPQEMVAQAYERWDAGDHGGFLALIPEGAIFAIPGATHISGDHSKDSFRRVLEDMAAAVARGDVRQEMICAYESTSGVVMLFDTHLRGGGKYHSMHEWIFRDGSLVAWMLYVHEYDIFARTWGS